MQAHGDRRSSGRAHRGQKELALVGAARLLHHLVLHGAALGLLVLVRSLRLPAILVHVLVLDGWGAAAFLAHLTLPDVVVHAAGHESRVSKSVCSRVSERGAAADSRGSSPLTVARAMALGQRQGIDPWAPLGSLSWQPLLACSVPALLGDASLVLALLSLARLSRRGLVHHLVGKRFSHLAVPRQLGSLLLLDGHGARRGPWRRLDALGLARVLLASTGWYK